MKFAQQRMYLPKAKLIGPINVKFAKNELLIKTKDFSCLLSAYAWVIIRSAAIMALLLFFFRYLLRFSYIYTQSR